ncbi:ATP-binding protein [Niveispirillum sp.]|uniref:hybrid sensor histidine kinase/response regulator n=1 Tax=Niveispirillum sp. TaxID=1917217 RepID=UPI001B435344|nr:ATP-binding protein [Niveispirillum sp.]MBP7335066.1 response regulator [Niveispirillum sp.]
MDGLLNLLFTIAAVILTTMNLEYALLLVNAAPLLGASALLAVVWWHGRREVYALAWAGTFGLALLAAPMIGVVKGPFTLATGIVGLVADFLYNLALYLFAYGAAHYAGQRLRWRRWLVGGLLVMVLVAVALARNDGVLRQLLNAGFIQVTAIVALSSLASVQPRRLPEWVLLVATTVALLANSIYLADLLMNRPDNVFDPLTMGNQVIAFAQPFIVAAVAMGASASALLRVTDRLAAERAAAEVAAEQARAADRAKSEFLATISHEIRTPINAIQGCLQILETHNLNAAQIRLLEVMGGSSSALLTLIDDVLDMARLEAGRLEMQTGPVDLGLLLGDLMSTVGPRAERKGLVLSLRTGDGVPSGVVTDAKRLRQILLCLLDNGVKFTEQGRVTLSVDRVEAPGAVPGLSSPSPMHWVRFQVVDTGIGIPPEKLDRIFEVFSQADNSITRRFGGAGLGLSIARSLTEMLGGNLTVDSDPDQGSQFTLCLPLVPLPVERPRQDAPILDSLPPGAAGPPIVLLVEDDEVNRFVATELLVQHGAEVLQAANGSEAIAVIKDKHVDAIIMDLSMPDMDGLEAARRLRAMGGRGQLVPIIALTANLSPEIRQQCRDAGMQAFLAKPIKLEHLIGTLSAVLPQETQPAA